ncbi:uncharacterized protein LOC109536729 isoform X2 [Dendroctonus ponderosae]|uniref:uncharacterized protein LOC109536729 isoform X2 n=1 Tax=Dendroctonus ponderosae TaxID=77166 RepID=UPI002034A953|nr:uncharacterized protein LOC109536729 isoform X2 [Dendroctonus ponderosae]
MAYCEHMVDDRNSGHSTGQTDKDKLLNIQNELIWGLTYRNYKEHEKNNPLVPLHSPINIPFELCRAGTLQGSKFKEKRHSNEGTIARNSNQPKRDGQGIKAQRTATNRNQSKSRKQQIEKPTLLDRNVWSQTKYMSFLSVPNMKFEKPTSKKYIRRCELAPCPPRFVQLAVPNRRRVFANWKEYVNLLPTEMLMRYEEILHTDQNLDPREARYYYMKLDRQKRKERRKKLFLKEKKRLEKKTGSDWMRAHIDTLASSVLDYIQDEPLFALNYKQMLLSDGILDRLEQTKTIKKTSRKTKNHYQQTIIEVTDKFAVWIDTLTKFVDVQAIESDVDIPPVSVSSLAGESERESGEGSAFSSSSFSSEELRDSQLFEPENRWSEEGESVKHLTEGLLEDLFKPGGEAEGEYELDEILNGLDRDVLDKLIRILGDCSDEFLDGYIDEGQMSSVTYRDVLDRLKELRDGLSPDGEKPFLEKIMIDWAIRNHPDDVNDEILQKIHEVAGIIGDFKMKPQSPVEKSTEGPETEDEVSGPAEGDMSEGAEESADHDEGEIEGADAAVKTGEDDGNEAADDAETTVTNGAIEDKSSGLADAHEDEEGEGEGDGDGEGEGEGEGEEVNVEKADAEEAGEEDAVDAAIEQVEISEGSFGFEFEDGMSGIPTEEDLDLSKIGEEEEEVFEGRTDDEGSTGIYKIVDDGEEFVASEMEYEAQEGAILPYGIIKGHKPSKVFEHSPGTVCCLSLKTWAVWLLEITHNAHNWTQWMSCVIQKIREYAAIVRGDVKKQDGQVKVLPKAEWRQFIKETEESVVAWRQYSAHVKDLSQSIVENFHNKKINCCPKCLQDHLIRNVVVAHDTLQALTEAVSCAAYWQRCLDTLMEKTCGLTDTKPGDQALKSSSEESSEDASLEEVVGSEESGESIYEIEGVEQQEPDPAT